MFFAKAGRESLPSLYPFLVVFLSFVYGALNLYFFSGLPEFRAPIPGSDTALYWYLGKLGREKGILFPEFKNYFFSPVYAYLFVFFSLLGNSVSIASIFSFLCYVLSSLLVYFLLELIFKDSLTALLGALLFIFYKPVAFYSLLPLKTMFFLLLFLSFLYFFHSKNFFLCGVCSALSFLLEGITLPLTFVSLIYAMLKRWLNIKTVLAFLCGFFLILAPFSLRNLLFKGSFFPLPPISGIHFYIGNNEKATGIYRRVNGIRPNAFGHYFDAKEVAERESHRKLSDQEVNDFWKRKAFSFIKENPKKFLLLYFNKFLLTFNGFEVPNNFNIYAVSEFVPTLKFNFFDFSILFPLGLAGVLLFLLKEKKLNLLIILLIIYPFILSLFFITSRYRILLVLFLIPYAAFFLRNLKTIFNRPLLFLFVIFVSFSALKVSRLDFPYIQKEVMKSSYERRVFYASRIAELEKRRLYMKEARIFYLAGMKEVGSFLRAKALSAKIKNVKQK